MINAVSRILLAMMVLGGAADPSQARIRTDFIGHDGFERPHARPAYRVDFAGDRSLIFTETGQSREISVVVLDSNGYPVSGVEVTWELSSYESAALDAKGLSAVVRSLTPWSESVQIIAKTQYGDAYGEAVFATLGPRSVWVPSSAIRSILGDRGSRHRVELARSEEADAIEAGSILVSGDQAGVLVEVLAVKREDSGLMLDVEPALITDAYRTVIFQALASPLDISSGGAPAELPGRFPTEKNAVLFPDGPRLRCTGAWSTLASEEENPIRINTSLVPVGNLRIEDFSVKEFHIEMRGALEIAADPITAAPGSRVTQGECTLAAVQISPGHIMLGPISVSPTLTLSRLLKYLCLRRLPEPQPHPISCAA